MKKFFSLLLIVFTQTSLFAQFEMPIDDDNSDPILINTCSGTFTDDNQTAGDLEWYSNNQDATMTICPDDTDSDTKIRVIFNMIKFDELPDKLTIYDGADSTAPILTEIDQTKNLSDSETLTISASLANSTGCLTFHFFSDSNFSWVGWEAEIVCTCDVEAVLETTLPNTDDEGVINIEPGDTVTFTGGHTFTDPLAVVEYTWTIDNETDIVSLNPTLSYTFDSVGTHYITLSVKNLNNNCTSENTIGSSELGQQVDVFITATCESSIDAGADTETTCENPCVTLVTDIDLAYSSVSTDTSGYIITYDYCIPDPVPATATGISTDDSWTSVINIGFDFEFFGNTYSQLLISDNGVVTFDLSNSGGFSDWSINNEAPSSSLITNAIFGAYHDLYTPAAPDPDNAISYFISGEAPYRKFIIDYDDVPHYSCNEKRTTQQIILYETSNIIAVNIEKKDICTSWQSGVALLGIQNDSGTLAFVPQPENGFPNRNTSAWEVIASEPESWQFVPIGMTDPEFTFTWYDEDGEILGTNPNELEVCPTEDTTYIAELICENCNEEAVLFTDSVTVVSNSLAPSAIQPEDLHQYDDDTDGDNTNGIGVAFDLTSQTSTIEDGQTDVATTYYLSETDAVLEDSPIDTPNSFINTVNHQEIWARVENTVGCYNITMFHLIVDEVTSTDSYVFYDKDYLPFFTPNNDGYNDYWHLVGLDTQEKAKIHIYTKSGTLITKIDPRSKGWDGKLNGKLMPATDYWFAVLLEDGSMKTGHFSLIIDQFKYN